MVLKTIQTFVYCPLLICKKAIDKQPDQYKCHWSVHKCYYNNSTVVISSFADYSINALSQKR